MGRPRPPPLLKIVPSNQVHTVHLDRREFCECGLKRDEHASESGTTETQGQGEWTFDKHTKLVATDAFGDLHFESACSRAQYSKVVSILLTFSILIDVVSTESMHQPKSLSINVQMCHLKTSAEQTKKTTKWSTS